MCIGRWLVREWPSLQLPLPGLLTPPAGHPAPQLQRCIAPAPHLLPRWWDTDPAKARKERIHVALTHNICKLFEVSVACIWNENINFKRLVRREMKTYLIFVRVVEEDTLRHEVGNHCIAPESCHVSPDQRQDLRHKASHEPTQSTTLHGTRDTINRPSQQPRPYTS